MKKNLLTLGLVALLTVVVYGEEKTSFEVKPWNFSARTYAEVETYEGDLGEGGAEDEAFFGVGVNAASGKWSYDLNVEKRGGGTTPGSSEGWEQNRVDYKVRYQALSNVGVQLKYRDETQAQKKEVGEPYYQGSKNRDRIEIGTDWGGVLKTNGWFVVGFDTDTDTSAEESDGTYWEGDFGPSFKINDKLTLTPTIYTTGEDYDGYTYRDQQIRLMASYKLNDKITLMPRVRYSIGREVKEIYESSRYRFEFMGNTQWDPKTSSFWGVAYDYQNREMKDNSADKDLSMVWGYFSLSHSF